MQWQLLLIGMGLVALVAVVDVIVSRLGVGRRYANASDDLHMEMWSRGGPDPGRF